jgi:hypothetical protein
MTPSIYLRPLAAPVYLPLSEPRLVAQPPVAKTGNGQAGNDRTGADAVGAADGCRGRLKSFDSQIVKDGCWRSSGSSGFATPRRRWLWNEWRSCGRSSLHGAELTQRCCRLSRIEAASSSAKRSVERRTATSSRAGEPRSWMPIGNSILPSTA